MYGKEMSFCFILGQEIIVSTVYPVDPSYPAKGVRPDHTLSDVLCLSVCVCVCVCVARASLGKYRMRL